MVYALFMHNTLIRLVAGFVFFVRLSLFCQDNFMNHEHTYPLHMLLFDTLDIM